MLNRDKLLLGVFKVDPPLYNDKAARELAEIGADYIISVEADEPIVRLCEKYHIPMFTNGRAPFWWGGDGDGAGKINTVLTNDMMTKMHEKIESDIIVGDYLVDEPSSADFAAINELIQTYEKTYPGKIGFVNLYPNYASVAQNTGEEKVNQLGNASYEEHIDQYIREIDNDYLCLDFYPYQVDGRCMSTFLRNMKVTADACREHKRDLWFIFQAGAWKPEEQIAEFMVRWQCFVGLAYGCKSLQAAAYYKAWWDPSTSCVDLEGNKNPMYDWIGKIYRELHALGDAYMSYEYKGTYRTSVLPGADEKLYKDFKDTPIGDAVSDEPVLLGEFAKANGRAVCVVNCADPFGGSKHANVTLKSSRARVWMNGVCRDVAGDLTLTLPAGEGAFVEFI